MNATDYRNIANAQLSDENFARYEFLSAKAEEKAENFGGYFMTATGVVITEQEDYLNYLLKTILEDMGIELTATVENFEILTIENERMLIKVEKDAVGHITRVVTDEDNAGLPSQFGGRDSYRTTWLFVSSAVGWYSNYYHNQCEHALVIGENGLIDPQAKSADDIALERENAS